MYKNKCFSLALFLCSSLFSQTINVDLPFQTSLSQPFTVDLPSRTTLDDEDLHLTLFSKKPTELLILPKIDLTNATYFDLFNSRNVKNDEIISCVVFPSDTGDILYVDLNNDENLTNDGGPIFFSRLQNEIVFNIISTPDTNQIVKLLIQRKPDLPDTSIAYYVDSEGNLNPKFAAFYGAFPGQTEITGKRGTFYFDDRVSFRSGNIEVQHQNYRIGIFDYDNNGLFNDSDDVLIVDLDRDEKLRFGDYSEVSRLNEVFTINNSNYKLTSIDPYGLRIELTLTNKEPQRLFLKKQQTIQNNMIDVGILDSAFWDQTIRTIDGKPIRLQQYKGTYFLLNFWGEWCKPCVAEIPALIEAFKHYNKKKLAILGLLQPSNLATAKNMITSKKMKWKQSILSEEFKKKFAVKSFPTNILILPDGITYVRTGSIFDKTFFEQYIH